MITHDGLDNYNFTLRVYNYAIGDLLGELISHDHKLHY